ncbi:MAG: hypothetical protein U9R03_04440 [Candidatus Aerophobetes bacterium]|nr:hypothetical protein [Candidatus Aerophobetes bacterium]
MQLADNIKWYNDGERANAIVLNRPLKTIVNYLDTLVTLDNSMSIEVFDTDLLSEGLVSGDYIYVDQIDSMYRKALCDGTQSQNVIGAYITLGERHYITYSGVVGGIYEPGRTYYLSSIEPGKAVTDYQECNVVLGMAISTSELILNISGNTTIVYYPLPQIERPIITSSVSGQTVTYTITNGNTNVDSFTWDISGTGYTIISGSLTGSTDTELIITATEDGDLTATVKAEGDNQNYVDSLVSLPVSDSFIIPDFNTTVIHGENKEGIALTDPGDIPISTLYFNALSYDSSVPASFMYFSANGRKSKVDFATEYNGNSFEVELDDIYYIGSFITNEDSGNPIILQEKDMGPVIPTLTSPVIESSQSGENGETVTFIVTDNDANTSSFTWNITGMSYTIISGSLTESINPSITVLTSGEGTIIAEAKSEGDDINYLDSEYSNIVSETIVIPEETLDFDSSAVHGESVEGISVTDPGEAPVSTVWFNKVSYDSSVPAIMMYFSANGRKTKLDYATEYDGDAFEVELDSIRYTGIFSENQDSTNPTLLTPVS